MIERIKKDFIPVALKAGAVQKGQVGIEGRIYRELLRTQPAPQGIGVMNSAGKVLAWSLTFADDDSVPGFFDYAKKRYAEHPDSGVACERFRQFPGAKMDDVADKGTGIVIPKTHGDGDHCPGDLRGPDGALTGKVVGRAYGEDGKPISDVRTQDNYIEDRFEITKEMQATLQAAAAEADGEFLLPQDLARALISGAHLGHLDVNPLAGARVRGEILRADITLRADKSGEGRLLIYGRSDVAGKSSEEARRHEGRFWDHAVDLNWRGFIDFDEKGIREIALFGRGDEQLSWQPRGLSQALKSNNNPVAHLPTGRSLEIDCAVRYGVTALRAE